MLERSLIPFLHHWFETAIHSTAIFLNILLFIIVSRRTTLRYADYKYVIQLACVSDILLSAVYFICQPAVLKVDDSFIFVSNGFFAVRWPTFEFWLQIFFSSGVQTNVVFISVPFAYRYFNVCRGAKASLSLLLKLCIAPAIQALCGIYITYRMVMPADGFQSWALANLNRTGWPNDYGNALEPFLFGGSMLDRKMIEAVAMYDFGALMTTIVIVYCEMKVMKKLKTAAEMMRPATRRMHDEMTKALIALAVAPLILSCLPIGFFLFTIVARINPGPIMAVITSQLSWIAIANPITTTFFVRPYRHAVLGWFKVPHSRVTDATYARGRTDGEPKSTGAGLSVARSTLSDSKNSSVNS